MNVPVHSRAILWSMKEDLCAVNECSIVKFIAVDVLLRHIVWFCFFSSSNCHIYFNVYIFTVTVC